MGRINELSDCYFQPDNARHHREMYEVALIKAKRLKDDLNEAINNSNNRLISSETETDSDGTR